MVPQPPVLLAGFKQNRLFTVQLLEAGHFEKGYKSRKVHTVASEGEKCQAKLMTEVKNHPLVKTCSCICPAL